MRSVFWQGDGFAFGVETAFNDFRLSFFVNWNIQTIYVYYKNDNTTILLMT